jgi:hypothetical protein
MQFSTNIPIVRQQVFSFKKLNNYRHAVDLKSNPPVVALYMTTEYRTNYSAHKFALAFRPPPLRARSISQPFYTGNPFYSIKFPLNSHKTVDTGETDS